MLTGGGLSVSGFHTAMYKIRLLKGRKAEIQTDESLPYVAAKYDPFALGDNLKKFWPLLLNPFYIPPIIRGKAVGRPGGVSEAMGPVNVLRRGCVSCGVLEKLHYISAEQSVMETGCWDESGWI